MLNIAPTEASARGGGDMGQRNTKHRVDQYSNLKHLMGGAGNDDCSSSGCTCSSSYSCENNTSFPSRLLPNAALVCVMQNGDPREITETSGETHSEFSRISVKSFFVMYFAQGTRISCEGALMKMTRKYTNFDCMTRNISSSDSCLQYLIFPLMISASLHAAAAFITTCARVLASMFIKLEG